MKTSIFFAIVISLFLLAPSAQAQYSKTNNSTHHRTTMTKSGTHWKKSGTHWKKSGTKWKSSRTSSIITGAAPGDPYNLHHPFFKGRGRWSSADSLYTHGDFPWALVSQHSNDFRFNASTGKWEVTNTADLQKSR